MNLSDYIRQVGPTNFAAQLGCTERAAMSWMYKARTPRREVAERIVEQTPVTWAGINDKEPRQEQAQ